MKPYIALTKSIDRALAGYIPSGRKYPSILHKAMRYVALSRGHRWRSILLLTVHETFGGRPRNVLAVACGLELVHNASLILDDLPCMDDAEIRRGKPCCHIVFGEDIAILASVSLLTLGFELISKEKFSTDLFSANIPKVLTELIVNVGSRGMCAGQTADLRGGSTTNKFNLVEFIHAHKSAGIYGAAAAAGALLANGSERDVSRVREFGIWMGRRYQVLDDIFDAEGRAEELGKKTGMDIGKDTAVSVYGLPRAKQMTANFSKMALSAIKPLARDTQRLHGLLEYMTPSHHPGN